MCSAFKFKNCFGRNFDYEQSYNEEVIIAPEGAYEFNDYAYIGVGSGLFHDEPLLYDGMNSEGLCVAGLAFTGNAVYGKVDNEHSCFPAYNFTSKLLGLFSNVKEIKNNQEHFIITDEEYYDEEADRSIPNSPLHWIVSDDKESVVIESTDTGLHIYDNPFEVLTNNPPFPLMQKNIRKCLRYLGHGQKYLDKKFASRGTETIGLNGDYTSTGRFERIAYLKQEAEKQEKFDNVETAFHLCQSVEQIYGITQVQDKFEYTIYSAVYDTKNLELFVRKYDDLIYKEIQPISIYDVNDIYRRKI